MCSLFPVEALASTARHQSGPTHRRVGPIADQGVPPQQGTQAAGAASPTRPKRLLQSL